MSHVMLYGPQGSGKSTVARALADMFGLPQVIETGVGLFKVRGELPAGKPALVVREATEAPARDLAQAYGFRTVIHVDDARRLLQHAFSPPPLAGLDVVDGTGILKGNADLSPEEQRALDAAQANLRG